MNLAHVISGFNRERKWNCFLEYVPFDTETKILDVGFNNVENSPVDNYLEKKYPFQKNIVALGVEGKDVFERNYPDVSIVLYDGNKFPFDNKSFDVCWSNAVIEHVGDFKDQLNFVNEMVRVSKLVFFTTPNRHFPIEVHTRTPFLHLLPKSIFFSYLRMIGKSWATGNYMNLLSKKEIKTLLKSAGVQKFRIIENRILGFSLDYTILVNS